MRHPLRAIRRWFLQQTHPALSRVFTLEGRSYRVCLECGRELEYDLATMRLTGRCLRRPIATPDIVAVERQLSEEPATAVSVSLCLSGEKERKTS